MSITKRLDIFWSVDGAKLQPHDFYNVHNLFIFHDLRMCGISHIQGFTFEREDAIVVTSNHRQTRHSQ